MYPNNDLVHKVGKIFATDGQLFLKKFCDPINTRNGRVLERRSIAANMAARQAKMYRDALVENLMSLNRFKEKKRKGTMIW